MLALCRLLGGALKLRLCGCGSDLSAAAPTTPNPCLRSVTRTLELSRFRRAKHDGLRDGWRPVEFRRVASRIVCRARGVRKGVDGGCAEGAHQPEVANLERACGVQEQIAGLEVAMDHPLRMDVS